MLNMIKSQNPDKDYPINLGKLWTDDEEKLLLDELNKNIDIKIIAENHNRTEGGIYCRCKAIAYKMYLENITIDEIKKKTKLDKNIIKELIEKKQNLRSSKMIKNNKNITIEDEVKEMKNEIKEMKNMIKELVEMMKAVYEFENA